MPNTLKLAPNAPGSASMASLIETDQIACHILRFLLKNENAMDSAKGIAAWWVKTDELAVQPSLSQLFACGAIVAYTLNSGTTLYGLSHDEEVRVWLRNALGVPKRPRKNAERRSRKNGPLMAAPGS